MQHMRFECLLTSLSLLSELLSIRAHNGMTLIDDRKNVNSPDYSSTYIHLVAVVSPFETNRSPWM